MSIYFEREYTEEEVAAYDDFKSKLRIGCLVSHELLKKVNGKPYYREIRQINAFPVDEIRFQQFSSLCIDEVTWHRLRVESITPEEMRDKVIKEFIRRYDNGFIYTQSPNETLKDYHASIGVRFPINI
jgi:hypothetical protein